MSENESQLYTLFTQVAVSYTHLDVYKRQLLFRKPASRLHVRLIPACRRQNNWWRCIDVYKRQRYEVRLEPRMALLARSRQNAIYQNLTVPQIVEKILRERQQMRCLLYTSGSPAR